jgi:hypothetical protein
MKKIAFIVSIFILTGCYATRPLNKAYVGMSISEFLKIAKYPEIESGDGDLTVYRYRWGLNAENTVFYYFRNGKLVRFDGGVPREKRYRIETINN